MNSLIEKLRSLFPASMYLHDLVIHPKVLEVIVPAVTLLSHVDCCQVDTTTEGPTVTSTPPSQFKTKGDVL